MFCPICGADVPESKYCQNCGSLLGAGLNDEAKAPGASDTEAFPSSNPVVPEAIDVQVLDEDPFEGLPDSSHEDADESVNASSGKPHPSVYQWNDVEDGAAMRFSNKAPYTAFVLVIIGLVLGLAGFTVYPIVPALLCCIAGLVLNRGYRLKGKDNPRNSATVTIGVIGIVVALVMAVVFVFMGNTTPAVSGGNSSSESQASATAGANDKSDASSSGALSSADTVSSGSSSAQSSEGASSSSSSSKSASSASSSAAPTPDPRSFDAKGNPTLYAVCELTGSQLQDELAAAGFVWVEGASTWISTTNALLEVQGEGGLMTRDDISRLGKGAKDATVAYVIIAEGYGAPEEALRALGANVTVKDTYVGSDADVVFALVRGPSGGEYLTAVTKTDVDQQTVLVFTKKAVENGLFSEITGVDSIKSIDDVWKALKAGKA